MKHYSKSYVEYLVHFHGTRDFFECHELLEEYWKQETDPTYRVLWHGLIQVAVSAYHERRGNYMGAYKMLDKACEKFAAADLALVGLDTDELQLSLNIRCSDLKRAIEGHFIEYHDPQLPIQDASLLEECQTLCAAWGEVWNRPSPLAMEVLVHRHKLRDRSDVISERQKRLAEKQQTDPMRSGRTDV